jgi:hypothetical protein
MTIHKGAQADISFSKLQKSSFWIMRIQFVLEMKEFIGDTLRMCFKPASTCKIRKNKYDRTYILIIFICMEDIFAVGTPWWSLFKSCCKVIDPQDPLFEDLSFIGNRFQFLPFLGMKSRFMIHFLSIVWLRCIIYLLIEDIMFPFSAFKEYLTPDTYTHSK